MFRQKTLGTLDCLVRKTSDNEYTCILLHGFGSNAADMASLAYSIDPNARLNWIIPEGWLDLSSFFASARAWFNIDFNKISTYFQNQKEEVDLIYWDPQEMTQAHQKLKHLIAESLISPEKIILGGFSQGGMLCLDFILSQLDLFAGIIMLSSGILPLSYPEEKWQKQAHLKYFISHGTEDNVLSFAQAKKMSQLFEKYFFQGKTYFFPGRHTVTEEVIVELKKFLLENYIQKEN